MLQSSGSMGGGLHRLGLGLRASRGLGRACRVYGSVRKASARRRHMSSNPPLA